MLPYFAAAFKHAGDGADDGADTQPFSASRFLHWVLHAQNSDGPGVRYTYENEFLFQLRRENRAADSGR